MIEQTREFLQTVYGGAAEHGEWHFYLWSLRGQEKLSWWFRCDQIDEAASKAQELTCNHCHVYAGAGLMRRPRSARERVEADQIEAIPAIWGEVDFGVNGHKKKDLPPTEEDALSVLLALPHRPTLTVRSGGGLYGWWLFKEPWIFENDHDRRLAAECTRGWNVELIRQARRRGWGADNIGDLSRVLRVPGTMNVKYTPTRLCELVPDNAGQRLFYNPSDFELWSLAGKPEEHHIGEDVVVTSGETQPTALTQLLGSKRKIKATWDQRRDDLSDSSQSGYDWELAFLLVEEGWTDQAITDALCAFRYNADAKKVPSSYYRRTIAGARERSVRGGRGVPSQEKDVIIGLINAVRGYGHDPGNEHFLKLLSSLSARMGHGQFKVLRGCRYRAFRDSVYHIWVEDNLGKIHSIGLGTAEGITNQERCRHAIFEHTGILMARIKSGWDLIAQMIWAICDQDVIYEATVDGQVRAWLEAYLEARRPSDSKKEAGRSRRPWREDGKIHLFLDSLRHWLRFEHGVNITAKELGYTLRTFGCTVAVVGFEVGGKRTTRSVWSVDENVIYGDDDQENSAEKESGNKGDHGSDDCQNGENGERDHGPREPEEGRA